MSGKRDQSVSVARGIAICCMVVGHTFFDSWTGAIYFWHMPLFFFFSGYFFDHEKYGARQFLYRKIKTLYWPFVAWQLTALALHNTLVSIHISPPPTYDLGDYVAKSFVTVFQMTYAGEDFLGTFWFLSTLFAVNIIAYVVSVVVAPIWGERRRWLLWLLLAVAFLMTALVCNRLGLSPRGRSYITWLTLAFFFCGKLAFGGRLRSWKLCVVCLLIASLQFPFSRIEMLDLRWRQVVPYFVFALCGIVIVYNISVLICRRSSMPARVLAYMGNRSLAIMILHFICFRIVTLVRIAIDPSLTINNLSDHPMPPDSAIPWRIAYIVTGVGLPLLIDAVYRKAKGAIMIKR